MRRVRESLLGMRSLSYAEFEIRDRFLPSRGYVMRINFEQICHKGRKLTPPVIRVYAN